MLHHQLLNSSSIVVVVVVVVIIIIIIIIITIIIIIINRSRYNDIPKHFNGKEDELTFQTNQERKLCFKRYFGFYKPPYDSIIN